jgi:lysophospholipase L1-like esterase
MSEVTINTPPIEGPFSEEIRAFVQQDEREMPSPGGVLFVGSSSIKLWANAQEDFPFATIIRRGFGGSTIANVTLYADYIVIPYRPRLIVMYAGDNDIAFGKSPENVCNDFRDFVQKVHVALPETMIAFASIKFSLSRWHLRKRIERANDLIWGYCLGTPNTHFIDMTEVMLDEFVKPRPELFTDGLHPNRQGYREWVKVLAPAIHTLLKN